MLPHHREVPGVLGRGLPGTLPHRQGGARRARQAPHRRALERLLQARPPGQVPGHPGHLLEGRQAGVAREAHRRPRGGQEAAGPHRPDRRRPGRAPAAPPRPDCPPDHGSTAVHGSSGAPMDASGWLLGGRRRCSRSSPPHISGSGSGRCSTGSSRSWAARVAIEGPSMEPTIAAGDWLLVDPLAYRGCSRRRRTTWCWRPTRATPRSCSSSVSCRSIPMAGCGSRATTRCSSTDSRIFGAVDPRTVTGRPWFRYWPPRPGRPGRLTAL